MRLIDADALMEKLNGIWDCNDMTFAPVDGCCIDADCKSCRWRETIEYVKRLVQNQTTITPWRRVEEPPEEAGEYIVAYHPCWWDDVKTQVTKVGIDYFRGKASWAKRKTQRVTHWMEKPEPPKEEYNA